MSTVPPETASSGSAGTLGRIRDLIVGENTGAAEMRDELSHLAEKLAAAEQEIAELRDQVAEQEARLTQAARALLGE